MPANDDEKNRPLYMISVAAELTGMHPQTLRIYESKGLVNPRRSSGNTRLYSQADIERLDLIGRLTDEGINLAGVVRILDMKTQMDERDAEIEALQRIPDSRIRDALMELSDDYRMVVYYADVEDLPYKEIAEIMGTPIGTVMSRLHRGRKQLRTKLKDVAAERGIGLDATAAAKTAKTSATSSATAAKTKA